MKKIHVHLLGIGGTGMTALAGLLKERGVKVTGSDLDVYPPMSAMLEQMKIEVCQGFQEGHLIPPPDVAVIGNVIARGNEEAEYILDKSIEYMSMPEMIKKEFLRKKHSIVVAGTHGKTTTASLLSWIFTCAGYDPGFLIGGIPKNLGKNYHDGSGRFFIIEGDEYETAFFDKGPKFMHYMPRTLVLGNIEYDHADIYKDLEEVLLQFKRLLNIVPKNGRVIYYGENSNLKDVVSKSYSPIESFGFSSECFWRISSVRSSPLLTEFDLHKQGEFVRRFAMKMPGRYNMLNATAALAVSLHHSIDLDVAASALESFEGARRRFDVIGSIKGITLIDDFAHHPTAIKETLRAARERYPGSRIWALFEPRSWSMRRNVFQQQLASSFDDADEILCAPVYKADQLSDFERLDAVSVITRLKQKGKKAFYVHEGVDAIVKKLIEELCEGDVVVMMSNGNFDNMYSKLLDKLSKSDSARSPSS